MSALLSPPALPLLRHRRTALAAGSLLAALALAGCAATGAASSGAASGAPEAVADGVVAQDRAALAPGEAVQGSGTGGKALPALPGVVTGPSVIVMASLTVRTPDVPAATAAARGAVAAAGGTITSSVSSSGEPGACDPQPMADGGSASAGTTSDSVAGCPPGLAAGTVMTLRVPPARLDALTADLSRLGDVVSASTSSTDVAAEVADVDARVATARASLARVRALMERATTIADIVALEGELAQRQGDLEALEARQRVLADETARATLTLTLTAAPVPVAQVDDSGFLAGLRSGWAAFGTASGVLLTALGASLPFVLLGLVVVALVWAVRRRVVRRDAERAAAAAAGAGAAGGGEVRDDEPVGAGA